MGIWKNCRRLHRIVKNGQTLTVNALERRLLGAEAAEKSGRHVKARQQCSLARGGAAGSAGAGGGSGVHRDYVLRCVNVILVA